MSIIKWFKDVIKDCFNSAMLDAALYRLGFINVSDYEYFIDCSSNVEKALTLMLKTRLLIDKYDPSYTLIISRKQDELSTPFDYLVIKDKEETVMTKDEFNLSLTTIFNDETKTITIVVIDDNLKGLLC